MIRTKPGLTTASKTPNRNLLVAIPAKLVHADVVMISMPQAEFNQRIVLQERRILPTQNRESNELSDWQSLESIPGRVLSNEISFPTMLRLSHGRIT